MGKSIPVTVGGITFAKKGDLIEAVQELIGKYKFGDFLAASDMGFCLELFKLHTRHEEKIGRGIRAIEVRRDEYGHRYFHLHRNDGTDTDISWRHCITPKK